MGAIDTLLVDMDEVVPGTVDETDGRVTFHATGGADSYDVVDEIACRALLTGARVRERAPARHPRAGLARGDPAPPGLTGLAPPHPGAPADERILAGTSPVRASAAQATAGQPPGRAASRRAAVL